MSKKSIWLTNFIFANMDIDNIKLFEEMADTWTPEQTEAITQMIGWSYAGGKNRGYKKGFIVGGATATMILSAYAIYCYKKAHKDENQEQ